VILYVEPRTAEGQVPAPSDLLTWSRRFGLALAVPRAFADFLDDDLRLATSNDPSAQLGIWLRSYQPLTVMVDIDGLRVLPGSSPSNQFIGWTFADPDGKSAAGVARELMIQLCEYELHLDDFERVLGRGTALTTTLQRSFAHRQRSHASSHIADQNGGYLCSDCGPALITQSDLASWPFASCRLGAYSSFGSRWRVTAQISPDMRGRPPPVACCSWSAPLPGPAASRPLAPGRHTTVPARRVRFADRRPG
jgi:hypothetical protein